MSLTPHQALSIVIIIYYVPSLVPTSFLLHRHSLGRSWGWIYLFIFAVFRVTGASLQFASGYHESDGLRTAASMLASVGVMTLLLAMLEIVMSVKTTLGSLDPIPARLWTLLHLSQWAAFILSIIFATAGGQNLNRAAAVLVTCLFVSQVVISLFFYQRLRSTASSGSDFDQQILPDKEQPDHAQNNKTARRLFLILLCGAPFLAVRVVYMVLSAFKRNSIFTRVIPNDTDTVTTNYESTLPNIYIAAFMQSLMEFIVFGLWVYAGFVMPSLRKEKAQQKALERAKADMNTGGGSEVELRERERRDDSSV
ncbi:hypothetical protein BJX70DRAFT_394241 [Aspergillus crustosus]